MRLIGICIYANNVISKKAFNVINEYFFLLLARRWHAGKYLVIPLVHHFMYLLICSLCTYQWREVESVFWQEKHFLRFSILLY